MHERLDQRRLEHAPQATEPHGLNGILVRGVDQHDPGHARLRRLRRSAPEGLRRHPADAVADEQERTGGCCQSNGNLSPVGCKIPYPALRQAVRVRHSARAAERRSL